MSSCLRAGQSWEAVAFGEAAGEGAPEEEEGLCLDHSGLLFSQE